MRPAGADRGANLAALPQALSGGGSGERSGAAGPVLGRLLPSDLITIILVVFLGGPTADLITTS